MKRLSVYAVAAGVCGFVAFLAQGATPVQSDDSQLVKSELARIKRGFEISPVHLDLRHKNPALVGLGSYIVNAQAACSDCHSCPTFAPGGNPFFGEPKRFNAENYLAGGVPFGPFISANLTPDENGKPNGLTFEEFLSLMRTGHEPDEDELLQVMPWPTFGNMLTHDIRAIYEFLRAIPPAQPGTCSGPGE